MKIINGYIASLSFDAASLNKGACAAALTTYPRDVFKGNLERALFELQEYHNDFLNEGRDRHPELAFTLDADIAEGPFDVLASIKTHVEKRDRGEEYTIFKRTLCLSFSEQGKNTPFYEMPFKFGQLTNSLSRYRGLIRTCEREMQLLSNRFNVESFVHNDLDREEGHEGIIASLFPHYNKNAIWETDYKKPDFEIDFGLACRIFNVFRATFPEGPFADFNYATGAVFEAQPNIMYFGRWHREAGEGYDRLEI